MKGIDPKTAEMYREPEPVSSAGRCEVALQRALEAGRQAMADGMEILAMVASQEAAALRRARGRTAPTNLDDPSTAPLDQSRDEAVKRFKLLADVSTSLAGSMDVDVNLASVARLIAAYLDGWCLVSVVDRDGVPRQLEVAHADPSGAALADQLRNYSILRRLMQEEDLLVAAPITASPVTPAWLLKIADGPEHAALLRRFEGSAAMLLPLRIHNRIMGLLALFFPTTTDAPAADLELGEDLARLCALALENARLYADVVAERDKVTRASRAKDEFVAILAHELRNPLTPLAGWIQVLKTHAPALSDVLIREGIGAMDRNARKLKRLVTDCVELARISEGKLRLDRRPVDLNGIVAASIETVRELAVSRGCTLSARLSETPLPALADSSRIEQVVTNLLLNAVNYSDSGGTITIETYAVDQEAEIVVTDQGAGIDPAFLDQIFQPFRQGTSAWLSSRSGLGLGLTIARQITQLHDGRVWAESKGLGQGSTFRVRLPMLMGLEVEDASAPRPVTSKAGSNAIRILVVEDAEDILFLMKTELEMQGYDVSTAADGRAGLEAAKRSPPDLIISDIKMPMVDGYEMIREIRATPGLSHIPAIALTGFGERSAGQRARDAGFNACLSKPAEREELLAEIHRLSGQDPKQVGRDNRAAGADSTFENDPKNGGTAQPPGGAAASNPHEAARPSEQPAHGRFPDEV